MLKKKKVWVTLLSLLLALAFTGTAVFPAMSQTSDPLADFKEEKYALEQEMKEQKAKIRQTDAQLKTFQGQLATVEAGINKAEKELESADIQLQVASNQLADTTQKLEETQVKLEHRAKSFQERLRATYVNGQVTVLDVFFEATSMDDFLSRFYYLEQIMDYDMDTLDAIEQTKAQVEEQKAQQEEKKVTLEALKQSKEDAVTELTSQKKEKATLVAAAEQDKATAQKAYAEMEAESKAIAAQIKKLQEELAKKNTPAYTGKYLWPLSGYYKVTSDYGMRYHPILKVNKKHTGIDISAPNGTPIMAAGDGTVIIAQYNSAYGNMVIIDHGGGISTLYGHMSSIGVSVGNSVKKGDVIGKVGSTGWSTGNHLHFEVRKNGSDVNPWNYVSK